MKWWGPVTWLTVLALALARGQTHTGGPGGSGPSSCNLECMKVYTLHNKEFEQVTRTHCVARQKLNVAHQVSLCDGGAGPLCNAGAR